MISRLLFALPFAPTASPYGTYFVEATEHGLKFQVSVRDRRNNLLLIALIAASLALALATYAGFWSFVGALALLLLLVPLPYLSFARSRLNWVEVRPDGLAITPDIAKPASQFFDRRAISRRELDFDAGLSFRYGVHDVQATPSFSSEREFEIFEIQFEQAIARLWHQENLNP